MNFTGLLAGGAVLGFVTASWGKIKAALQRIVSLFIQRVEFNADAYNVLVSYMVCNYKRSPLYDRYYMLANEWRQNGRFGYVAYENFGSKSVVFWSGWTPIYVGYAKKQEQADYGAGYTSEQYSLTFIRGTVCFDKLFETACDDYNSHMWNTNDDCAEKITRFFVRRIPQEKNNPGSNGHTGEMPWYRLPRNRLLGVHHSQLGKNVEREEAALDNLIFPPNIVELINEIRLWATSRTWYRKRFIPWKRGWLLYGIPGTGKTALARAFAEDLDLPVFLFNIAELGNRGFVSEWLKMQASVPCIALIEDIDNVFHGRTNVIEQRLGMFSSMMFDDYDDEDDNDNGKVEATGGNSKKRRRGGGMALTFDTLLNCLDGIEKCDGVFTIITSNDISKVDPALGVPSDSAELMDYISTRPGRIDKVIELTHMLCVDKKRMAKRILGDYPPVLAELCEFVDAHPELLETPAQFQERCAQLALKCYWRVMEGAEGDDVADVPSGYACFPFPTRQRPDGDGVANYDLRTQLADGGK